MAGESVKRARGRPKTFDRDRTLDIAIDGYWRDGVDSLSVNEICRRANISKPGLYREFGSEDHLLDAALTRYFETVLAPALDSFSEDRSFPQTLDALIEFATQPETSQSPAGCLFARMRTVRDQLGPTTGEHVDRLRERIIAVFTQWLEAWAQRGDITLPGSVETTASYLDTQLTLALNRMAAGEDPTQVREHTHMALSILTAQVSPE